MFVRQNEDTRKKRLVLFTTHYPYRGEAFLEDEIRAAELYYTEIIIVTLEKNTDNVVYYIPQNARVIAVRAGSRKYSGGFAVLCKILFSKNALREIGIAAKERGMHALFSAIRTIAVDERAIYFLKRAEKNWLDDTSETVYYSYWLGSEATYLVRNRKQLGGLCISRTHGGDCFFNRAFHPYRVQQLSQLDLIFPISESGKKDLLKHYVSKVPALEKKLVVAHLGISKPTDQMNPENKSNCRIIVTCSNVIRLKRLDLMVDALSRIESIKIHWIHFGDGDQLRVIKKLAAEKLKPNVIADFRGFVPKSDILRYYAENPVDLFINCSDAEGIPVSVMEAMSYGIPVIARDVGGTSELVDPNCGILLKEQINGSVLADAIHSILYMDRNDYRMLQINAYAKYQNGFKAETNYVEFFRTIAGKISERR